MVRTTDSDQKGTAHPQICHSEAIFTEIADGYNPSFAFDAKNDEHCRMELMELVRKSYSWYFMVNPR